MEEERTENPESSQSVSHIFFFSQTVPVPVHTVECRT